MLLVKDVLDKGCQHKRQYRSHTWNHFLDGWSKAICKAFHTRIFDHIKLYMIRQDCFCCWQVFDGLFSVASSLRTNSSLLILSESSINKSCSSLKEKHFQKFVSVYLCNFYLTIWWWWEYSASSAVCADLFPFFLINYSGHVNPLNAWW